MTQQQAITNGNELIVRMTAEAAMIEDRDLELDCGSFLTVRWVDSDDVSTLYRHMLRR